MVFICILSTCFLQVALRYLIKHYGFNKHFNIVVLLVAIVANVMLYPVLFSPPQKQIAVASNSESLFITLLFWFIGVPASIITHSVAWYYNHKKQSN